MFSECVMVSSDICSSPVDRTHTGQRVKILRYTRTAAYVFHGNECGAIAYEQVMFDRPLVFVLWDDAKKIYPVFSYEIERVSQPMSAKIYLVSAQSGAAYYEFYCPGCGHGHVFEVPRWTWNGLLEMPTFTPSLLCNSTLPERRCHLFVTNGQILYQQDCFHELAGKTIDMEEYRA